MGQQPVQPRYSDVVDPFHTVAERFSGQSRFFTDGQIAGASRYDRDRTGSGNLLHPADQPDPRDRMILEVTVLGNDRCRLCRHTGDQNVAFLVLKHRGHNPGNLFRGFSGAVDDLCRSLPQPSVMINLGVAEILKWLEPEPEKRLFRC